jgi:hypothetical protein
MIPVPNFYSLGLGAYRSFSEERLYWWKFIRAKSLPCKTRIESDVFVAREESQKAPYTTWRGQRRSGQ